MSIFEGVIQGLLIVVCVVVSFVALYAAHEVSNPSDRNFIRVLALALLFLGFLASL